MAFAEVTSISVGISLGGESATLAFAPTTMRDANGVITSNVNQLVRPTVIAAEDGERSTPAFGAIVDGAVLTGAPAKNAALRFPENSVGCLAALLSKTQGFDSLVKANVDYKDASGDAMLIGFEAAKEATEEDAAAPAKNHSVKTVLKALLAHLAKLAEGATGGKPMGSVVVAVPRYVDAAAVKSVLKGVDSFPENTVLEVIYDDVAAMLAHGMGGPSWSPKLHHHGVLVVDAGATATQVSVLTAMGGVMTLMASDFITETSGKNIDVALGKQLVATFKRKCRGEPELQGRAYRKLLVAAEKAKKTLTSSATANAEVEAFWEGQDLTDQVSRGALDTCLKADINFYKKVEGLIEKVLKQATEQKEGGEELAISHVILHGGIMRIPSVFSGLKTKVLEVIESVIENDDQLDMLEDELVQVVEGNIPGDEAAALGATIQASLLANGCDASGAATAGLVGQMKRAALTFDIGFWGGAEAPTVDEDGNLEVPESDNKDDDEEKDEPKQQEAIFKMVIQKGSALPMEMNLEVDTETTLLLVARTGYEAYLPLASSVDVPKSAKGEKQTLQLLVKLNGECTITPVPTGETFAPVEPLLTCKLF